ncbi:MAG: grasp-with-spasm system ATP-grasp peptide maturase [Flavobacteriales bacterium]|nr:grasp-with-spasm system ATP-grasp peptide maturase [Flavobacteriales bacterium]
MKVVIFSSDYEKSTNQVIDWLANYHIDTIRLNCYDDFFKLFGGITLNEEGIRIKNETEEFVGIWYRRQGVTYVSSELNSSDISYQVKRHLKEELDTLFQFCFDQLSLYSKKKLGSTKGSRLNKLNVLLAAKKVGLLFPKTMITMNKRLLSPFLAEENELITKPISEAAHFTGKNKQPYAIYTEKYTHNMNETNTPNFFPSLFQKNIKKEYEIRTYYMKGNCYSMAIFSQQSEMSKTDFRVYDTESQVRYVPYILPENIEKKVFALMSLLELDEGSLDFIKTVDGKIVFLEVNPAGQFGMVSRPCNYYLEEKIARYFAQP